MHIDVLRTWEFTETAPLRSIVPIYTMCGLPFFVLKVIASCVGNEFITSHTLIIAARLTMAVMSFSIDALCGACPTLLKDHLKLIDQVQ